MASDPEERSSASPLPDADAQISSLVFALILIDPDGRVAQLNHAAESLLRTSAKRLIGQNLATIISPLDDRVTAWLGSDDGALVARDVRVSVAGRELSVNLTMSGLSTHPGWRVLTVSELAHEKASGEETGERPVGAPSILAHEIKNPLAAIRGAAQLIARKLASSDQSLAHMITNEVDRIARLIDRMQLLGSKVSELATPCNPHEAIRSALATVRAGGLDGVEIIEEFDPSLPPVLAHQDSLEQVLINLISNGRDALESSIESGRPAQIIIKTRYVGGLMFSARRQGRTVQLPIEISVSDNGPGVDPDLRDKLFDPFVTTKPSGQGLGLALVRKLMRDMDGSISHERDGTRGLTCFRLHLPVAESPAR
ncbi:MAG: ATP-binding protein [Pseudomonadota bacterium]